MAATISRTTERGRAPGTARQSPGELHHLSQLAIRVLVENRERLYSEQYKVPLGCTYICTYIYTEVEYCIRIFAVRSL